MNAKQIGRSASRLGLVLIGWLLWLPQPAAAVYLPAPDFSVVLSSGQQVGLRSRHVAVATAAGDFDGQSDGLTKLPLNWEESVSFAGSVAAADISNPQISSFAEFQGRTQVGKLKARTRAWVENGFGTANAVMDMQFMDVLQVDSAGVLNLHWVVSGTADMQTLLPRSVEAGSALTAELYVWPYGTFPIPGMPFNFTNYARSTITGETNAHLLPNTFRYAAGSRWWVLGQLSIQSRATATNLLRLLPPHRLETTADFGSTVELFISPDPSTPDASFHSASGYDYRVAVVPEPAGWLLLIAGMLTLRLLRRRPSGPTIARPQASIQALPGSGTGAT